jgi:hypothetical protein
MTENYFNNRGGFFEIRDSFRSFGEFWSYDISYLSYTISLI